MPRGKTKTSQELLIQKQAELDQLKSEIKELEQKIKQENLQKIADAIEASGKSVDEVLAEITAIK